MTAGWSVAARLIESAQRLLGFFVQLGGNLYNQCDIVISPDALISQGRYTFALQTHFGICLGTWLHIIHHISVHCADTHFSAQGSLCISNGRCGEDIHILSLEDRMAGYDHFHHQIASGTSIGARFSLFPDADALSVVDSCRNGYLDLLAVGNESGSPAVRAFLFDDLSGSLAVRTGLDILNGSEHGLLGINDLT